MRGLAATITIVAGFSLLTMGCGKPVLRVADASLGDYYTEKEYRKLSEEQRLEYCQELADQDSVYREEIADARGAGDRFSTRSQAARAAADSLARLADSLDARLAEARRAPQKESPAPAAKPAVTVRRGDSLWRISARETIYGDGRRWNQLYEANRDRIRDADRIYPGQELVIPR
jgi:nucleoid-associated protein YgaU